MNREDVIREIHERYRQSGRSLNELQRRLWAAAEAMKLGRGGITIVSKALRISPNTIKRGIQEIADGKADSFSDTTVRIRKPGGGRKASKSPENLSPTTPTEAYSKPGAVLTLYTDRHASDCLAETQAASIEDATTDHQSGQSNSLS